MNILSYIFLFLLAFEASAKSNHFVLMGGGGEPVGETTIFDTEILNLGKFLTQNPEWNAASSFNGGHAKTDQLVAQNVLGKRSSNTEFTAKNFEALVSDYENRLNNGQIKPGEQLLIQLSSHGAMNKPNERSHSISTSGNVAIDLNTLEDPKNNSDDKPKTVNLDRLQNLINLAASKKI